MPEKLLHDPLHPSFEARLRFRCRRGMLELDAVLNRFYHLHYARLNNSQKSLFSQLLDAEDPDLQAWLIAGEPPPAVFASLITYLRATYHD